MVRKVILRLLGPLVFCTPLPVSGQMPTPKPSADPDGARQLRNLTGDDVRRHNQLADKINSAMSADRWDEAIAPAAEILSLRRRVQGPKHSDTVQAEWRLKTLRRLAPMSHDDRVAYRSTITMAGRAKSLDAQGMYAQAQLLFEKALEIRRRLLTDDNVYTEASYVSLARNLDAQAKYAQAQPLFEKALDISRRLFTDDHPNTAMAYDDLASNLYQRGKYTRAQPLFERALEIRRRLLTDDHPATADSYNNVAYNLNAQGKYTEAQPLYEKALEIHRRILTDDHRDTAAGYNNLATNVHAQGKYAEAKVLYENALATLRRLLGDNHPDCAGLYTNLAGNLNAQRKYTEAQPLYLKALDVYRRLFTDNHPLTATAYNNLAQSLDQQRKYTQAQPIHEKVLEIRRRLLTDDHADTAISFTNLGYNLSAQGKCAEAQKLFEKVLEIRRRLLTDDHPDTAESYNNLGANLQRMGEDARAEVLLEKALKIYRRLLTDDHPRTAACCDNLALSLNAQGKYLQARDQWFKAVKSLDAARLRVAFTGMERATRTDQPIRPSLAAVLARLRQSTDAWKALEESLGRGLLDELAARENRRLSVAERARLRELTGDLERLDKLLESPPNELDKAQRAKEFEELKRQREFASIGLGEFRTKLVETYGALAGRVATLGEIQAALPPDAALVAWVDVPPAGPNEADPDGEHWGVVIRSRGIPAWVPLAGTGSGGLWTEADTMLAGQVRQELSTRTGGGTTGLRPVVSKLRAQRLDPLAKALAATPDSLPSARRLIVLPSSALAGIPIEVLAQEDSRVVSYAPSATVFKYQREQPRPDPHAPLLALGDPVYGPPVKSGEPRRSGDEEFAPLPGTRREVEAIARLFKSDDRPVKALFGADASEPELDRIAASGELGRFGFIHLATHGVIDEAIPSRSAVILTQTGLPDPLGQVLNHKLAYDGRLLVREIQHDWGLKAELVTLSACETALGRVAGGEGFVGFTQALLMSGARSVCLSLWKVDDTATALLMTRFYQNLLGKRAELSKPMPKAEALQEAKHWLRTLTADQVDNEWAALGRGGIRPLAKGAGAPARKEPPSAKPNALRPYEHPYFWAAFVLVGDPD